ncbi:MAG: penicillin-binding protein 1C [Bacteroidetes bacterium]|nr:penicillin-binding protein 1C [Bacteroidota bacterium]
MLGKHSKYWKFLKKKKIIASLCVFFILFTLFWFSIPSSLFPTSNSYVIEDRDGNLLSAAIAPDGQWRFPYDEVVPYKFIKCITTFEDKRFYHHPGVDILALGRATLKNIKSKGGIQGGSTITMQVMRLSRQGKKRSYLEKIIECIQSVRLECTYSKKEIMALYASHAPFGSNVVGLDAAAWRYYGRSPKKLSWGEMAALAVLPNAPSLVHPGKNSPTLLKKRNYLLDKLLSDKIIDSNTCYLSKLEPLPGKPLPLPQLAPHLLQRFRADVQNKNITADKSVTTIDEDLQQKVTEIINRHHDILKGNAINNACALVLDVKTSKVLAYVGNVYDISNPDLQSDVDVIRAPRSPGSALKPILYASALSEGLILPHSLIPDIPTQVGGYTPENYDRNYDGAVPASLALSRSLNIPAVKILQQYKYARFYDLLKQLGMTTLNKPADNYGLSLILGGGEVTMWDLAGIYAGMARTLINQKNNNYQALKRDFFQPQYLASSTPSHKSNTNEQKINALDPTSIWFTFQAMEEVMRPGEEGLWQQFASSQKIAWKTGTSFGFRDAWAIGITPKYVVAVWTGNTTGEGRPGLVGVQTSAPIMFDIFRALPSSAWFQPPEKNFIYLPICHQSGFRANVDCNVVDTMMLPANAIKSSLCPYHQKIHLDATGTFQVNNSCYDPAKMLHESWFVLPPTMEYYFQQKNHDYKLLPPFLAGCNAETSNSNLSFIYPEPGARIYVPIEIDGHRGKTIFKAASRKENQQLYWHLDNQFVATTTTFHQVALSPSAGTHTITIVNEKGESLSRKFTIIEQKNK